MMSSFGLRKSPEAPPQFQAWMNGMLRDWSPENVCCAHDGVKTGGVVLALEELMQKSEHKFQKMSKSRRK
jgi:hypothetical protein